MQSGVVATVDDRDWECNPELIEEIDETNACALDMESATVAGGCLINATPHASLLCISDNPLDGRPKLAGAAQKFYERSKRAHLRACIRACESLAEDPWKLHSRKLRRPRTQVPFR
jgi:AMP nucleosidase